MEQDWQPGDLERLDRCVVCASGRLTPLYDKLHAHDSWPWRLDRCVGCGAGLLNPRPRIESITKAYPSDYSPYAPKKARPEPETRYERLHRVITDAYLARRWRYRGLPSKPALGALSTAMPALSRAADRLVRFTPAPTRPETRLLDVGCAGGSYLELMRELGWNTRGIEIDANSVAAARELGLDVRQGAATDVDPDVDGTFEYVTMGHVIEHTHDPVKALRSVHRVLEPGGQLWIATPNLDSLGARIFRDRYRALDPPRHLVLFTPRSLRIALRQAGFGHVQLVRASATAAWHFDQSAQLAGIAHRRAIRFCARAINGATYFWPKLCDEMVVIAHRA
jgi:2-polyprenyl-3-methyl-5-hydroxy-6-metoxy-1,4-benzoquinol methylase